MDNKSTEILQQIFNTHNGFLAKRCTQVKLADRTYRGHTYAILKGHNQTILVLFASPGLLVSHAPLGWHGVPNTASL